MSIRKRRAQKKVRWTNIGSLQCRTKFPAEMLLKTIVSVNQLSIYRAAFIWYLGQRREGDNVAPNTNLHIAQDLVTKAQICLIGHREIDRVPCTTIMSQLEFKSPGQVSPEAEFSNCGSGTTLRDPTSGSLEKIGNSTTCRENSAMRGDSTAAATGCVGRQHYLRAHPQRKDYPSFAA